jgi:hypothetical protein
MLNKMADKYNLKISTTKSKVLGFKWENHLRAKIITDNNILYILEHTSLFNDLGHSISFIHSQDPEIKLQKYLQLIGTIKIMLLHKVRINTTKNSKKQWSDRFYYMAQKSGY